MGLNFNISLKDKGNKNCRKIYSGQSVCLNFGHGVYTRIYNEGPENCYYKIKLIKKRKKKRGK